MRRALVILGALALVAIFVWVSVAPPGPAASPSPTPTATAAATTPGVSPTPTGSPAPPPTGTAVAFGPPLTHDDVTVRAAAATPGTDIHYIVTRDSSAKSHWVLLLDLGAKGAQTVAQVDIAVPEGAQAAPGVNVSWSSTGEHVLITAFESGVDTHFFAVDVRQGSVRHLMSRSSFPGIGVISPDGGRYAFNDGGETGAQAGLFVAPTAGGEARRVIATDPQRVGGPPVQIAFSPNGAQIAARVTAGPGERAIAIVPTTGNEARYTGDLEGGVLLEPGSDFSWAGAPDDAWAWDPVDPIGGTNSVWSFDTRSGRGTRVYEPAQGSVLHDMGRSPELERFFTIEGQGVISAGPGAIWIRTRQGDATKAADIGETGPHQPWWSADGARLYALMSEDDSVGTVIDVLTGETILAYCHRGPTGAGPCV